MEAAGIEPASEETNQSASTSLARSLISNLRPPASRVPEVQFRFVFRSLTGNGAAAAGLASPARSRPAKSREVSPH